MFYIRAIQHEKKYFLRDDLPGGPTAESIQQPVLVLSNNFWGLVSRFIRPDRDPNIAAGVSSEVSIYRNQQT